jgi:hypothetical protein
MGNNISLNLVRDSIGLDFALQLVGFAISAPFKTEKFYDAFGSSSFIACSVS